MMRSWLIMVLAGLLLPVATLHAQPADVPHDVVPDHVRDRGVIPDDAGPVGVPEIQPAGATALVTLLVGGAALLTARRRARLA